MMLQDLWKSSSSRARVGMLVGVLAIVVIAVILSTILLKVEKKVLFSDLMPQDAARIVAELERMKEPYELASEGTEILVNEPNIHALRLKLMGSGMPLSGGVGYEVFDKAEFGMTEFAQRINFQRALQGELARTIMSLNELKYARVHLVLPEGGLFKQKQESPSASVTLFLKGNNKLTVQQITGIQRLVAASVPGLKADKVTIVDQTGVVLSPASSNDSEDVAGVGDRLQKKKEIESYLSAKANQVLEQAYGPGNAAVSVDVTINFDQIRTTEERLLAQPGGAAAVTSKHISLSTNSAEGRQENTDLQYQWGKHVEQLIAMPGNVKRISVAVLVPLYSDASRRASVQELIGMAVGLDDKRGDEIAVHAAMKPAEHSKKPADIAPDSAQQLADQISSETGEKTKESSMSSGQAFWLALAVVVMVIVLVALVINLSGSGRKINNRSTSGLSASERQRILSQLRSWVASNENAA